MKNTRGFIAEERPDLIEEWHPFENKQNTPFNVRTGSDKIIFWSCKGCEYVWKTQAKSRAIKNTGCPKCHERYNVGFPELAIYFYVKQLFADAQLNAPIEKLGMYKSVDVFIPSLNLVIEYDGGHTHRERVEIDKEKSGFILDRGYRLIRVRDNGLPLLDIEGVQEYLYDRSSNKTVGKMIIHLLSMIQGQYIGLANGIERLKNKVNVDVDNIAILAQIPPIIEKDNLLDKCPEIEVVWDYDKNFPLRPEHFKQYSNFKAWFTCEQKHTTLAQIGSKAQGHGCKFCSGQVATEEYNLELLYPDISGEWDYNLNENTPDAYLPYSNQLVYWNCPMCKSTYDKMINGRTGNGEGCPYCAGKRVNDTNCLFTTHPQLTMEWNYTKNSNLTPKNVTKGSHEKVWWICEKNHSYQAFIYSRVEGRGCPKCYELFGRYKPKKAKRENSLVVKKPEIAKQWHPTKNGDISPNEVGAYAREEYWWICENGHEWQRSPNSRRSAKCKDCMKKSF
ncbi:zinc-ribbon domain-containing protein [Falsibacillus pallidus]|uniref:Putative zinc ribbon protein n=1 Tax=Falsibacillus pallidus TaxID=493781 RepID=A0A370G3E4_9BACI|nr:zinc-ribbon domain-containing protein [Falsibacillus pallidus]RDI37536.1 putative zinc ribbon protein [Falsibacillus pallidus]